MYIDNLYQFFKKRPIIHLLFWILFVLIGSFIFSYQQSFPYTFYLLNFLVHIPVFVLFTYGVIYFLVPNFLLNQKYWKFFISLILAAGIAAILRILIGRYVYFALFIPEIFYPEEWINADIFFINLMWVIGPAIVFAMFKYYKNSIIIQERANEAERKQLSSELQVLKAQLNPHFLFNTFNNLYVLALQKSDKTPEVISKISDLFHYVLYECNATEVPLSKEIKLISDYIQLEQLRYSDRLSISFKKEIDNPAFLIPPMMLYTFVENCFKHGCSNDPNSPWIQLLIRVKENRFEFEALNSIPNSNPRTNISNDENSDRVGLSNIKRRLELIYPKNHVLKIDKKSNVFHVRLEIDMGSNLISGTNA
jgi:two-component system, LytTR family, sensor kinase